MVDTINGRVRALVTVSVTSVALSAFSDWPIADDRRVVFGLESVAYKTCSSSYFSIAITAAEHPWQQGLLR
jgi:hypothetical protein